MRPPRGCSCVASKVYQRPADEGFEPSVQIHRVEAIQVANHHPRRDAQRAAQRNADVREVPAHTGLVAQGIGSSGRTIAHAVFVGDVLADPGTNRFDLVIARCMTRHDFMGNASNVSDGQ